MNYRQIVFVPLILLLTFAGTLDLDAQNISVTDAIEQRVQQIRDTGELKLSGASIASIKILPTLYERRNFQPTWDNPDNRRDLIEAIDNVKSDGLDPDDYHREVIGQILPQIQTGEDLDPIRVAEFDILLTDALIRLAYHLVFGKVDPEALDPNWNFIKEIKSADPAADFQEALDSGSLGERIDDLRPRHIAYQRMQEALEGYRTIQARGGWARVPPGPALKSGMTDPRVSTLRERLIVTGDLKTGSDSSKSAFFDEELEQAVIRFQRRHRLTADGVVGAQTFEALNSPVEDKIDQIRANLERFRWVLHEIEGDHIITDIAGFHVYYLKDGELAWESRAQVGKTYRKTPVFKSDIEYLVFNPTWTVPPTVLKKDILPKLVRDPGYLKDKNMSVLDRDGREVDPTTIDWTQYSSSGRGFPYVLRQEPGPGNALGRVKFIFPNEHFVYLHDTPSRSLFDRTDRAFSSGCIRLENPFELAEILLNDPVNWNGDIIRDVIESRETRTVHLPEPIPVLLLYWTTAIDWDTGEVHFKKDVYGRDRAILEGLDGEFKVRKRHRKEG